MYIYIYIYIYTCNHENKVPSQLSPQWLCSNSCTSAHDVRLHIYICFHDCMYITLILLSWDLSTLCVADHLWPLIYIYTYTYILNIYIYIYILIHIYLKYIYIYIYIYIYRVYQKKLDQNKMSINLCLIRDILFMNSFLILIFF